MHAAKLSNSPRLQRVLSVLWSGEWVTTRSIARRADVCAVNTAVDELRDEKNGFIIDCRQIKTSFTDPGYFEYRLIH